MGSHSDYMIRRCREERDAADRASSSKARDLHIELADRYREAADKPAPRKRSDPPMRSTLPDDLKILN